MPKNSTVTDAENRAMQSTAKASHRFLEGVKNQRRLFARQTVAARPILSAEAVFAC